MAPSTTTHSSTRDAWTLDTLAKEFGLIETGDEPYTRTGRAQMATLLAQEEVSDVYSTFNTGFLVGAKAVSKSYRGPNFKKVKQEAQPYIIDRNNSTTYRDFARRGSENWGAQQWYSWFIVNLSDRLRAKDQIWSDENDPDRMCLLAFKTLQWFIIQLKKEIKNFPELERAYGQGQTEDENTKPLERKDPPPGEDEEDNHLEAEEDNRLEPEEDNPVEPGIEGAGVAPPETQSYALPSHPFTYQGMMDALQHNRALPHRPALIINNKAREFWQPHVPQSPVSNTGVTSSSRPAKPSPPSIPKVKPDQPQVSEEVASIDEAQVLIPNSRRSRFCNHRGVELGGDFPNEDLFPCTAEEIEEANARSTLGDSRAHNDVSKANACATLELEIDGRYWIRGMAVRKDCLTEKQITAIVWAMRALHQPWKIAYLFDEMGLGKTITAIAIILRRIFNPSPLPPLLKPTLIILPKGVLKQWVSSFQKWATPDIQLLIYAAKDSWKDIHTSHSSGPHCIRLKGGSLTRKVLNEYENLSHVVVVATFETIGIHHSSKAAHLVGLFGLVVIDEAHRLRNIETKQATAIKKIDAEEVVALTGTPIYNQSLDVTGLVSLAPGQERRSDSYFEKQKRNPFNAKDQEAIDARLTLSAVERYILSIDSPIKRGWVLAEFFQLPCFLGRKLSTILPPMKIQVRPILPPAHIQESLRTIIKERRPKLYYIQDDEEVKLNHRVLKQCVSASMWAPLLHVSEWPQSNWVPYLKRKKTLKDLISELAGIPGAKSSVSALVSLTEREQAEHILGESPKALVLLEYYNSAMRIKSKLIGFVMGPSEQAFLVAVMSALGIGVEALHASMDASERTLLVQRFRGDKEPSLLVMSHILSNEGLNLESRCCVCIVLTSSYSWTWDTQSIYRIRRMVQTRTQYCIIIYLHDSIDSWFHDKQREKCLDSDVALYGPIVDPDKTWAQRDWKRFGSWMRGWNFGPRAIKGRTLQQMAAGALATISDDEESDECSSEGENEDFDGRSIEVFHWHK